VSVVLEDWLQNGACAVAFEGHRFHPYFQNLRVQGKGRIHAPRAQVYRKSAPFERHLCMRLPVQKGDGVTLTLDISSLFRHLSPPRCSSPDTSEARIHPMSHVKVPVTLLVYPETSYNEYSLPETWATREPMESGPSFPAEVPIVQDGASKDHVQCCPCVSGYHLATFLLLR